MSGGSTLSSLFGGGSSSATQTAVNLNPTAFTSLAPGVASGVSNAFTTLGNTSLLSATPGTLSYSQQFTPTLTGSASNAISALTSAATNNSLYGLNTNYLNNVLGPNYLNSLVSGPVANSAISAASAPITSTYQNVTLPYTQGLYTQGGQATSPAGAATGPAASNKGGSSAFDNSKAIAQGQEANALASASSAIELGSEYYGMSQQSAAGNTANTLASTEVSNLSASLNAQLLPTILQEQGISTGLSSYSNVMYSLLAALGVGTTAAKPVVGSNSSASGSSGGGLLSGLASGAALASSNPFNLFGTSDSGSGGGVGGAVGGVASLAG